MAYSRTDLPGFRFHPTEEELLDFYLKNMILGKKSSSSDVIGELNIYRHDPWQLPGLASICGEREWFFFVPRDSKQGRAGRSSRTTETGFWKATGSDRKVVKLSDPKKNLVIGLRKTLVFYQGRAPRGSKTDWVMNEYRLPDTSPLTKDMVLCKIYRKATSMKVLEQRAAMEEAMKILQASSPSPSPSPSPTPLSPVSFSSPNEEFLKPPSFELPLKKEVEESGTEIKNCSSLKLPLGNDELPQLQLPRLTLDWTQDSFWTTQFNSPWFQNLTASPNIINF